MGVDFPTHQLFIILSAFKVFRIQSQFETHWKLCCSVTPLSYVVSASRMSMMSILSIHQSFQRFLLSSAGIVSFFDTAIFIMIETVTQWGLGCQGNIQTKNRGIFRELILRSIVQTIIEWIWMEQAMTTISITLSIRLLYNDFARIVYTFYITFIWRQCACRPEPTVKVFLW